MKRTRASVLILLMTVLVLSMTAPAIGQGATNQHTLFLPQMNTAGSRMSVQAEAQPDAAQGPASHIVIFRDDVDADAVAGDLVQRFGLGREFVYRHALKGASLMIPPGREAAVRSDPRVASVERNQVVSINNTTQIVPTGIQRSFVYSNTNLELALNGTDRRVDVDVAVIDTGIDPNHPDLNVVSSVNCSGGSPLKASCKSGGSDDNGHGTHVAGTIGALDDAIGVVGMAPGARLWSVKVLRANGDGYMSWIVAGIDWVTANAAEIEVANMSLGCECSSPAMDAAISRSVAAGVTYVVAAGNNGKDAATFSPANHPDVITVSALADFDGQPGGHGSPTCRSDEDDTLANFSNWGARVDIAAPGVCILSTWPGGAYNTISGTSMASPHVAGAAALLAASGITTSQQISQTLVANGNFGWNDDSGDGIQEPLLDVSNAPAFNPATLGGGGDDGGDDGGGGGGGNDGGITLTATGYKVQGSQRVDLTWSGVTSTDVDLYRSGAKIATVSNTGAYTDAINKKGGGSYTYTVCEAGTSVCSNEVTVTF